MTGKIRSGDEIRQEIAGHLVAIAGAVPAGTSMKEIFRRVETRLAHPEINGRMVKALWYREVKNIPAHIADHVRGQVEAKPTAAFVIDVEGRIRTAPQPRAMTPIGTIRGRVEESRIVLELSPSRASYQGMATLRHWLLSLLLEERPCRLVNLDTGAIVDVSGPLAGLDRLEEWLKGIAGRPTALVEGPAMMADEQGIRPINGETLASLGIHPDADYDVASFLARNLGLVVFLPEGPQLQVLARASSRASRAVEHAAAYLALRPESVRLAVWWGGSWLRETEPDSAIAAQRLRRLCGLNEPASPPAPYEGHRLRLEEVPERELLPYRLLLNLIGRPFDIAAYGQLLASGAGDRLTIVEVTGDQTRFVYLPYGPDYYRDGWPLRAIGRPIREQPDKDYGHAVEKRYIEAAADNVVHFERVRATIRESGGRLAGEQRRSSYSRLIVPFRSNGQRLAVAYSSLTRQPEVVG